MCMRHRCIMDSIAAPADTHCVVRVVGRLFQGTHAEHTTNKQAITRHSTTKDNQTIITNTSTN